MVDVIGPETILDISQDATNNGGHFSTGNAKGTSLNQTYASQNIKYANRNTKYADQDTKSATKLFTLFCREAIFVVNLRTFLAYNCQMRWRTKNDKYQVWYSLRVPSLEYNMT